MSSVFQRKLRPIPFSFFSYHPIIETIEEEALPPNGEAEEGDEQRKDEKMSEKLSNISSEDIEMASAKGDSEGEDGGKGQRTPGKIII